jgi:hypothetical protein
LPDQGEVFASVTEARMIAQELEGLLDHPEHHEVMTRLRKRLKELHYQTIPWSS